MYFDEAIFPPLAPRADRDVFRARPPRSRNINTIPERTPEELLSFNAILSDEQASQITQGR